MHTHTVLCNQYHSERIFKQSWMRLISPKKHDVQNTEPKSEAAEARARLRTESPAGHNLGLNQWKISRLGELELHGGTSEIQAPPLSWIIQFLPPGVPACAWRLLDLQHPLFSWHLVHMTINAGNSPHIESPFIPVFLPLVVPSQVTQWVSSFYPT